MATKNELFGRVGEKLVEIELLKRNINFLSMSDNHPHFDLIVDSKKGLKKVQIKTSKVNKKNKFQYYLMNSAGRYDYLILVAVFEYKENEFYIIPAEEVEFNKSITATKEKNKYSKFKENWVVFL